MKLKEYVRLGAIVTQEYAERHLSNVALERIA
jgi:hypothetical protein